MHWMHPFRLVLNTSNVFFSYSNFDNIIDMVVKRAKKIPLGVRILFWHRCISHMFGYTVHTPL